MYKIQANQSGTRSIEVSDQHLETIEKYQLLRNLVDSTGIIDEEVLDKLKLNVRSPSRAATSRIRSCSISVSTSSTIRT